MEADQKRFDPFQLEGWREKLASNPRTARLLLDEAFVARMQEIEENPMSLMGGVKDARVAVALMVLMGVDVADLAREKQREAQRAAAEAELAREGVKVDEERAAADPAVRGAVDQLFASRGEARAPPPAPVDTEDRRRMAEECKAHGNECYRRREFDQALHWYNRAISLDRDNVVYHLNKSAVFYETGQWRFCAQICRANLGKITDRALHGRIAARLARACRELGENADAERYYRVAIEDGVPGLDEVYEQLRTENADREDARRRAGPAMTQETERLLMHDEVREIIRRLEADPAALNKLRKDPTMRHYIEEMLRAGILQSRT